VLFFNAFYRKARLGYPRDYRDLNDFALAESPEQTGDFNGVDAPFPTTHQLMLTYQRIWVVGWRPSAQLPAGAVRGESVVLLKRFTLVAHHRFRGVMVTLWARS
jgi:hypothetical protein